MHVRESAFCGVLGVPSLFIGFLVFWFSVSWFLVFYVFSVSWFQRVLVSKFLGFKASWLLGFEISWFRGFKASWFQNLLFFVGLEASWFQSLKVSRIYKLPISCSLEDIDPISNISKNLLNGFRDCSAPAFPTFSNLPIYKSSFQTILTQLKCFKTDSEFY